MNAPLLKSFLTKPPARGREPSRVETCPACRHRFTAGYIPAPNGSGNKGKACPKCKQWASDYALARARNGKPETSTRPATAVPGRPQRPLERRAELGIQRPGDEFVLALNNMVEGYDRLLSQLPEHSPARGLVEGAFGVTPRLARQILDLAHGLRAQRAA